MFSSTSREKGISIEYIGDIPDPTKIIKSRREWKDFQGCCQILGLSDLALCLAEAQWKERRCPLRSHVPGESKDIIGPEDGKKGTGILFLHSGKMM